jgi:glucokinase
LQQAFKTPVHLDTDVFCGALAEARLGGGHMCEATLYVAIGTGIGHAWILDGRVWRGTQGAANAIGHLVVEPEGARCYCGNRGCLCQYVSGPGLLALAARFGSLQPSVAAIVVAAREGNAAARLALRHANDYLAQGLAHAVNLMAPRRIVLAGGVIASGWPEPTALRRRLSTFCYPGADNAVAEIVCSSLGERSCLMGAALLTQKSLLQNGVSCDRPFFDR